MEFTGTKTLDLYPIGDIAFIWSKKSRRRGTKILVSEISILDETEITITKETEKDILAMGKSDLFTDGKKFYTTFGTCIREIKHPLFNKILNESKINL